MIKKILFGLAAIVLSIIVIGPVIMKFSYDLNMSSSPQLFYEMGIENLQQQIQNQLDVTKTSNLANNDIELIILNASLASIRLSQAREYLKNENTMDTQRYLNSAKNWIKENKKIIRKGNST